MIFCRFVLCEFNPLHCIPPWHIYEKGSKSIIFLLFFILLFSSSCLWWIQFMAPFLYWQIDEKYELSKNINIFFDSYVCFVFCFINFTIDILENCFCHFLLISYLLSLFWNMFFGHFFGLYLGAGRSIQSIMAYSRELRQI